MSKQDVFISYKRSDGTDFARYFNSELEKMDFSTFMDVGFIQARPFPDTLEKAIKDSDSVLVLLTPDSFHDLDNEDGHVRREIETAIRHKKAIIFVSKVDNIQFLLDTKSGPFFDKLREYKILEFGNETAVAQLAGIKQALDEMKDKKFTIRKPGRVLNENMELVVDWFVFRYEGESRNGVPFNKGSVFDDVTRKEYKGHWYGWIEPYLSGRGEVYEEGKLIYVGDWKKLEYDGLGIEYLDEATYEGNFEKGLYHGYGVMIAKDGTRTTGEWYKGEPLGCTELKVVNGIHYIGQLKENKLHGLGTCLYPNGDKYEGDYIEGARFGEGSIVFNNKTTYGGDWEDGMPDGKGKMITEDTSYDGDWEDGVFHGFGKFIYPGGSYYHGEWVKGQKSGNGTYMGGEDGPRYRGGWNDHAQLIKVLGLKQFKQLLVSEYDMIAALPKEWEESYNKAPIDHYGIIEWDGQDE